MSEQVGTLTESGTPASKLRPPRVWHTELTRTALLDDEHISQTEILAIHAPAGFGKTTLAIQWASRSDRPVVWMTLDEADNDPLTLISTIYAGLEHALPDFRAPVGGARTLREPAYSRTVLPQFRKAVSGLAGPVTVVVDELQLVEGEQSPHVLRALVESLPLGSQTAFVGRRLPGIPLPLWQGQGRVADIRASDLTFTTEQTRAALEQFTHTTVSDAEVEHVQSSTQGWPVAVYLISQTAGPNTSVTPTVIQEFLETEVLNPMAEDLRAFVCETAALGSVTVDLARYATGAARTPHFLGTEITTVLMQNTEDDWYHYHPLMSACASSLLAREDPERLRTVRCMAARWHLDRGHLETAVQLALASGDWLTMGEVVWYASKPCLLQGRIATVQGWLERAGERAVLGVAQLSMTAAWTNMTASDFGNVLRYADATLDAMPNDWRDDLTTSDVAPHLALLLAVTGYCVQGPHEAAELAGAAFAAMAGADPARALAALMTGLNLALIGDPRAEEAMQRAAALAKSAGVSSSEVESLALLGLLQMVHGRDSDGCSSIEAAEVVYAFHDLDRMLSTSGVLAIGRVALSAFRGRPADTREAVATLDALRPGLEDLLPWYGPLADAVLAFVCARGGDMDGFRKHVAKCDETENAEAALCRLWAARARQEYSAASPLQRLSPAELRVWGLLKGRMTLSEIAAQLFLSRETVKSHTVSIYRKLGVASRRQAQDLAESWR